MLLLPLLAGCQIFVDLGGKADPPDDTRVDAGTGDSGDTSAPDTRDTGPGDTGAGDTAPDTTNCDGGAAWLVSTGEAWPTVQAAIDAAASGDTVRVCPGTWTEHLVLPATPLTLQGYGEGSVLDGGGEGRVIDATAGGALTLRALTITGGALLGATEDDDAGAGLRAIGADVAIDGVVFSGNRGSTGAAVSIEQGGSLTVSDSRFSGNEALWYAGAIRAHFVPDVRIEDTTIADNRGETDGGGGVSFVHSAGDVYGCTFTGNSGGGLYASGEDDHVIADSTFEDNRSPSSGGAVYFGSSGTLTISGSSFSGNVAESSGGAIRHQDGNLVVTSTTFDGNVAASAGGALSSGSDQVTTLDDCAFTGNLAMSEGGAISVEGGEAEFVITDSTLTGNDALGGGALTVSTWGAADVTLDTCTVDGNTAYIGAAFDISGWGNDSVTLLGGSVTRNEASGLAGGVRIDDDVTLQVIGSDWGSGATDNVPDDVEGEAADYAAGATFTCTGGVCE